MAVTSLAVAGLAVSAYGAKKGSDAAKDSTRATTNAADKADQTTWDMYNQSRADQQPFYQAGLQAQDRYLQLMGLNPTSAAAASAQPWDAAQAYLNANPDVAATSFRDNPYEHYQKFGQREGRQWQTTAPQAGTPGGPAAPLSQQEAFAEWRATPGYQFGLDEGNKQVQSSAAAQGGLNSGATLKALQRYGTDYADQQGYTPYMNRLASLFGGAQTAAGSMGSYGQNAANNIGQNAMAAGNARAQGIYDKNSALNNGLNQISAGIGQWYGNRNTGATTTNWGAFAPNQTNASSSLGSVDWNKWGQGWGG